MAGNLNRAAILFDNGEANIGGKDKTIPKKSKIYVKDLNTKTRRSCFRELHEAYQFVLELREKRKRRYLLGDQH